MKLFALASPLSLALLLGSSSLAHAQTEAGSGFRSMDQPEGYRITFVDDPLVAGGYEPNGATIPVRKGAMRQTLIRPRVTFVSAMLKSVENL